MTAHQPMTAALHARPTVVVCAGASNVVAVVGADAVDAARVRFGTKIDPRVVSGGLPTEG